MSTQLTDEEKVAGFQTQAHMLNISRFMNLIVNELLKRANLHDKSKLQSPQIQIFTEYTHKLHGMTFRSEEYNNCVKCMDVAIQHHYANNRHHPEHFKNGVNDMNIIDLIEMLVDWKAASLRHADGNLQKSIQINGERFHMSQQLQKILTNSIDLFE